MRRQVRSYKSKALDLNQLSADERESSEADTESASENENPLAIKQERSVLPIRPSQTQTLRPSTPAHTIGRKRSLIVLSPQGISTKTTRELKKTRSAAALSNIVRVEDPSLSGDNPDDTTDNDLELGITSFLIS